MPFLLVPHTVRDFMEQPELENNLQKMTKHAFRMNPYSFVSMADLVDQFMENQLIYMVEDFPDLMARLLTPLQRGLETWRWLEPNEQEEIMLSFLEEIRTLPNMTPAIIDTLQVHIQFMAESSRRGYLTGGPDLHPDPQVVHPLARSLITYLVHESIPDNDEADIFNELQQAMANLQVAAAAAAAAAPPGQQALVVEGQQVQQAA